MAWGGSLNKKGSYHIRFLREADKVIGFLERIRSELQSEEQVHFSKTIEIITNYISKISERKE